MPYLHVHTNVVVKDKPGFLAVCSRLTGKLLAKPESYVMVELTDAQPMLFAGSDAPLAFVSLKSLGLSSSQTATISARLSEMLENELGIEAARIYIDFASPERTMFGWNGGTF